MEGRKIAAKDDGNQGSIFLPEELVIEILLRLHIKPLFRSKLVSKRWNSIISHPKFAHCYLQRASSSSKSSSQWHLWGILDPVVGKTLVQQWHKLGDSSKPVEDNAPPSLYSSIHKSASPWKDRIAASSGGLILSISRYGYVSSEGHFGLKEDISVFNPLTKQSAKLPLLSCLRSCFSLEFGLATRPGDHPAYYTYKVVVIDHNTGPYWPGDDHCDVEIHTFCSDIGRWTRNKMTTCPEVAFRCSQEESFSCKGILHWFDWDTRSVITYDPYTSPGRFGSIQLPSGSGEILGSSGMNLIHFGHEDVLMFGDIERCNDHGRRLRVWQLLDHAKGEWRLEQTCPISPLLLADDRWFTGLRKLVAPDPFNGELFCIIVEDTCRNMKAIDLGSAQEVCMDPSKVTSRRYLFGPRNRFLLIALCPWSSPFYG